jgi:acyl-coenzyme A synthetase/AMP-(fatty) acid ligase
VAKQVEGRMNLVNPPEYFNFAEDVLAVRAAESPERTAILSVGAAEHETHWSFAMMHEASSRLAHVLRRKGLTTGSTALIVIASLPHRVIAQLSVMKVGGVSVLLRSRSTPREVGQLLERASAQVAVTGPEDVPSFRSGHGAPASSRLRSLLVLPSGELDEEMQAVPAHFQAVRLRNDEPGQIVLTGGTTDAPKMVVHTQVSKLFHYLRWTMAFERDDLSWDLSGKWWIGAWRHFSPLFDRMLTAESRSEVVLDTLAKHPITRLMASAGLYRELVRHDLRHRPFAALRACWASGQSLDPTVRRAWREATGIAIYDRYSQSECGEAPVCHADDATWTAGCLGKPFPWIDMAIIDARGRRMSPGAVGDIAIKVNPTRPPWLFREYRDDPAATAARFRGDWYLTGDCGRADEAGSLFFVGRADDVINCGGENIGPQELESVLHEHPLVHEAAVVGTPDRVLGEIPKAFVVVRSPAEARPLVSGELMAHVNRAVHPSKRLRDIEFVESLPRTADGKIRRGELRERERQRLVEA